jgi:hypothetical protein
MARQKKKQKREQKRKVRVKQERSRRQAQPALLRKEPLLREALNHRYPLSDCRINEDWREAKSAMVYVVREAPTGKVLAAFLVDLLERGLKDVWGDAEVAQSELEELWDKIQRHGSKMVPCDYALAHQLVHGGILWARNSGFRLPKELQIWIRLMEPADAEEMALELFGDHGRPLEIGKKNVIIDLGVLQEPLALDGADLPPETLARIGDIKAALVDYFNRPEFRQAAEDALIEQYGPDWESRKDVDWTDLTDKLVLERPLADGKSIARQFVENYSGIMSDDVRRLVLGWHDVIQGLFEIEGQTGDRLDMLNLINERRYRVYATAPRAMAGVGIGDFIMARIVPAGRLHLFSGSAGIYKWDGSRRHRAAMYRAAVDMQMQFPNLAFRDNEEKLMKSREAVREQHEVFAEVFGCDEIVAPGLKLKEKYRQFLDHWNRHHAGTDAVGPSSPPELDLPSSLRRDPAAGLLSDPVEGFLFLRDYGGFLDLFARPQEHIGRPETVELLFAYLEDPVISDVPFRRVQKRFPEAFNKVLANCRHEFDVSVENVDDLMRIFKPKTFDKLPGTVVVLDSEITRIAAQEREKPKGIPGQLKGLFSKT